MPTLKVSQATHGQLKALSQQHLQPMKLLVSQLVALLHEQRRSPQALCQLVASTQERPQQLVPLLKAQESTFLFPILQKLNLLTALVEGHGQVGSKQLATIALQNKLEHIEALVKDNAAVLAAIVNDEV